MAPTLISTEDSGISRAESQRQDSRMRQTKHLHRRIRPRGLDACHPFSLSRPFGAQGLKQTAVRMWRSGNSRIPSGPQQQITRLRARHDRRTSLHGRSCSTSLRNSLVGRNVRVAPFESVATPTAVSAAASTTPLSRGVSLGSPLACRIEHPVRPATRRVFGSIIRSAWHFNVHVLRTRILLSMAN